MKKVIIIILLIPIIVFGKTNKIKKIKPEEILANIDKTAKSIRSFQAPFKQIEIDKIFDEVYESYGTFYFNKSISIDEKRTPVFQLRFDYERPEKSTTIINNGSVIIYTPDMDAPQESYLIDDVKMDAFFAPFVSSERLRENYDIIVDKETPKSVTVLFSPKSDIVRKHFKELKVTFSKSTWLPLVIYQLKRNGQKITFKFARPTLNRTISKDKFTLEGLKKSIPRSFKHKSYKPKAKVKQSTKNVD